jgi:hypothetical protein
LQSCGAHVRYFSGFEPNGFPWAEQLLRRIGVEGRAQEAVARAEAQLRSARREAVPDLQLRAGLQQNRQLLEQARMTDDVTSPSAAMVSILE